MTFREPYDEWQEPKDADTEEPDADWLAGLEEGYQASQAWEAGLTVPHECERDRPPHPLICPAHPEAPVYQNDERFLCSVCRETLWEKPDPW